MGMTDILEANSWLMGGLYRAGSNTFLKISSNKTNAQGFIQEYVDPRLFEKLENESTEESGKPNNSDSRSSSENSNRKLTDQEKARLFFNHPRHQRHLQYVQNVHHCTHQPYYRR